MFDNIFCQSLNLKQVRVFQLMAILFLTQTMMAIPACLWGDVVINEFQSSNSMTIQDEDGEYSDWIELFNRGNEPVDLDGYGLSDSDDDPYRWIFPSVVLEPDSFLLVWTSGKNRAEGIFNPRELIEFQSRWKYLDNGSDQGKDWYQPGFDDSSWPEGQALFGYGRPSDHTYGTVLNYGPDPTDKYPAYYFRKTFYIDNLSVIHQMILTLQVDDGAIVYLNGHEIVRHNMPSGAVTYKTYADVVVIYLDISSHLIPGNLLVEGENLIAVQVHQCNESSSDVAFDLSLNTVKVNFHTNFSIKAEGEELLLSQPDGTLSDRIAPLAVPRDNSFGRKPDGDDHFYFFEFPTPGTANLSEGYEELLSPPVFSHPGMQYTDPFSVKLFHPEDVTIRYTLDRTFPYEENALIFSDSISIDKTVVISARAYRPGTLPSPVVTNIYVRLAPNLVSFTSNLPLIILHQFDVYITPDDKTPAYLTLIDRDITGRSDLYLEPVVQSRIMADIRGSSSQMFPKKMFGFHLIHENGNNRDEGLLGMPPDHNWILYAPYSDKTLMRNVISYALSGDMGHYSPRTRFVELFLHSGSGAVSPYHYHGVYVLVERIKWGEGRVNIHKISPGDETEPEISGGYIIKKDRFNPGEEGLLTNRGTHLAFVRPEESEITVKQKQWIINYLNDFESALFGFDFMDPENGYAAYIDVRSFIDFHLITELAKEIDGFRLSTFMHKDRGGKLKMGPVWDFNLSFGNADYNEGWMPSGWYYTQINQEQYLHGWYTRFFQDPAFKEAYKKRWWLLRKGPFSTEYILNMMQENAELLEEAQIRNFNRWPTLGTYVWPNWYIGDTYEDEVTWMRQWAVDRLSWMDGQLGLPPAIADTTLLYFWYFGTSLPNDTPLGSVDASYSLTEGGQIEFKSALAGYPFTSSHANWRKASMERRNSPTDLNYRPEGNNGLDYNGASMRGLQIKQPFKGDGGDNTLIFHVPSVGYKNLILSFAVKDEGAADSILVDYSVSSENSEWLTHGLVKTAFPLSSVYQVCTISLPTIPETSDNPNLKLRLRFSGSDMTADNGDRVTFNNISLDGIPMDYQAIEPSQDKPAVFSLNQNYPNPFNYSTTISYYLPDETHVTVKIFDVNGKHVQTLWNDHQPSGEQMLIWKGSGLSSGIYLLRIQTSTRTQTRKMVLLK